MKPAPFDYFRPEDTGAILQLLRRYGEEAKILAGGQSLIPILNFRLNRFKYLIDINRVAELAYIEADARVLHIGALTRFREIENSPVVGTAAPLLATATRSIAHLPIRTRGTIGGSLAHADPAAEYPAVLLALDGVMVAHSIDARREIAAADFFRGLFATALGPEELLTEIRIPVAARNQAFGFAEFSRRPGDLAIVGIAARLEFEGDNISDSRVVVFGVGEVARRIPDAEDLLRGRPGDGQQIERAARAASGIAAQSDIHATAKLRQHLAGALTRRALDDAVRACQGRAQ